MNFVFHHWLAWRDHGEPGAALGAMLPDLFRMITRTARVTHATKDAVTDPAIARGMDHHLRVDAWFHELPSFHAAEDAARELLRATDVPRASLFAHVVLEMALDGALISRDDAAVRGSVDRSIAGREDAAATALAAVSRGRTSAVEAALLARLLEGVRSFALPEGYAHAPGLADRLQGIRKRLGFAPLDRGQRDRLEGALEGVLTLATPLADELELAWVSREVDHSAPGAPQP